MMMIKIIIGVVWKELQKDFENSEHKNGHLQKHLVGTSTAKISHYLQASWSSGSVHIMYNYFVKTCVYTLKCNT